MCQVRICSLLCAAAFAAVAAGDTISWTGAAGDQRWHTAGNWDLGRVPGIGDDVLIPGTAADPEIVYDTGVTNVRNLTIDGRVRIQNSQFSIGELYVRNAFIVNGSFHMAAEVHVGGLGSITVNGLFVVDNGIIETGPPMTIQPGGRIEAASANDNVWFRRELHNFGTFDWRAGIIGCMLDGQIINKPGGTFLVAGSLVQASVRPVLNQGTMIVRGDADSYFLDFPVVLQNEGQLRIERGRASFRGGGSTTNPIEVSAGAVLELRSAFDDLGGTIATGAGTLKFLSGTFSIGTLPAMIARVEVISATVTLSSPSEFPGELMLDYQTATPAVINGSADLRITGRLTGRGNVAGTGLLEIAPGAELLLQNPSSPGLHIDRPFSNRGMVRLIAGYLVVNGAPFTNESSGEIAILSTTGILSFGGTATLLNRGTLRKVADAGFGFSWNTPVENHGLIRSEAGGLILTNLTASDGRIEAANSCNVELRSTGSTAIAGRLVGPGQFQLTGNFSLDADVEAGPPIVIAGGVTMQREYNFDQLTMSSGAIDGAFPLHAGLFQWTGGTLSNTGGISVGSLSLNSQVGRELRTPMSVVHYVSLPVAAAAGSIQLEDATITLEAGCVAEFRGPFNFNAGSGSPRFFNLGQMTCSRNVGFGVPLENNGSIQVASSTLTLGGGGRNTGTIEVGADASISYTTAYPHGTDVYPGGPGAILFAGGTHVLPADFPISRIAVIGSTVNIDADCDFNQAVSITANGVLSGLGSKTFRGSVSWAGRLAGPGPCTFAETATVLTPGSSRTLATTLNNHVSFTMPSTSLRFEAGTLNNRAGATLALASGCSFTNGTGVNRINNEGTLQTATGGTGTSAIQVILNNSGRVIASARVFTLSSVPDHIQNMTLTGGQWLSTGGTLRFPTGEIRTINAIVELSGSTARIERGSTSQPLFDTLRVVGPAGALRLSNSATLARTNSNGLTNEGTVEIAAGTGITLAGPYIQLAGLTRLNGTLTTSASDSMIASGRLVGTGAVSSPSLTVSGTLAPGEGAVGVLTVGNLTLQSAATLELDLADSPQGPVADGVLVTQFAILDGTLRLITTPETAPPVGSGRLLVSGAVVGRFSDVQPASSIPDRCWTMRYGATGATLYITEPPPSDLNGDGRVDLADLAALLTHFGLASGATLAQGDLSGDGTIGLEDLAMMLVEFGTRCA